MVAIMAWLWSRISGYLAAIGVALAIIAGAFLYGRADGKADAEAEQAKNNARARTQARKVEDDVQNMGADGVDAGIAKWMRDGR